MSVCSLFYSLFNQILKDFLRKKPLGRPFSLWLKLRTSFVCMRHREVSIFMPSAMGIYATALFRFCAFGNWWKFVTFVTVSNLRPSLEGSVSIFDFVKCDGWVKRKTMTQRVGRKYSRCVSGLRPPSAPYFLPYHPPLIRPRRRSGSKHPEGNQKFFEFLLCRSFA